MAAGVSVSAEAARGLLARLLGRLESGRLTIAEGPERRSFGPSEADLRAEVRINDPRAWTMIIRGSAGWGEAYADGLWDADDLLAVCRIAAREIPRLDRPRAALQPLVAPIQRLARLVPRNTRPGARRNIAAHYDLGNELFETFLDDRLVYSCARFPSPDASLEDAQLAKLDGICRRLELSPDDHLVEVGSGWGALAIHAAGAYGCRVTATTISAAQRAYAIERVRVAGLDDRIEVVGVDYRDLRGRFDKLVSIEMIEAVGWQYFPLFFRRCSELLRDAGLMLLQAIVVDDRAYEIEKQRRSFANTLIFPGGCLPSRQLIADQVAAETDMRAVWSQDITAHYARTLQAWRERFDAGFERLRSSRYDERFRRLWRLYLTVSEAGFRERRIGDVQLLLAKPRWRRERRAGEAEAAALASA
jgi:cyclopropane-fatty-acyl-phospholipid synthase